MDNSELLTELIKAQNRGNELLEQIKVIGLMLLVGLVAFKYL